MNKLTIISSLCVVAAGAPAQATTYYFQTTGSDSNPCTYARPCRSFAAAIVVSLNVGDTLLALDSVDFTNGGAVNYVLGGITIDGGEHGAFLNGGPGGILGAIAISGSGNQNFILRNVTIVDSSGFPAIYLDLIGGASVSLENVRLISPSAPASAVIAGVIGGGSSVHMNGVSILGQGNGIALANQSGAPFSFAAENLLVDVTGAGVQLTDGYGVIRNSKFRSPAGGATGLALLASSATPTWLLDTCAFQNLAFGLSVGGGVTVRIGNSEFSGNGFGVFSSGTVISFRNNMFAGNANDGSPLLSTSLK